MYKKGILCFLLLAVFANLFSQFHDCKILKYDTYCEIKNGKLEIEKSLLIEIYNRDGEYLSDINLLYDSGGKLKVEEARIEDVNGNVIRKLRKKEIKESNAYTGYFFTDYMKKSFTLVHNRYPYRIFYKYRRTAKEFMTIANWSPVFNYSAPVEEAVLKVDVPDGYGINIHENGIVHSESQIDNKTVYTWHSDYIEEMKPEVYAPSIAELTPSVSVAPTEYVYGIDGKMQTWEDFARWVHDLNAGLDELPVKEKRKIKQMIAVEEDEIEKIKVLYHYLQDNTRYVNIAIGIGGFRTYPASYVVENKYGDCKALSNYMKSMLDYIGIESCLTLVNLDDNPEPIYKESPSNQFNHVILQVPFPDDTLWLECTNKTLPFGYVHTGIQNRYVLPVKESGSSLTPIPPMGPDVVAEKVEYKIEFNKLRDAKIRVSGRFSGNTFEYLNSLENNYSSVYKKKKLQRFFDITDYELRNWDMGRPHRDSAFIDVTADIWVNNYLKTYGDNKVFEVGGLEIPHFEKVDERSMPVRINYPVHRIARLEYTLPSDCSLKHLPNDTTIDTKYGRYVVSFKSEGDKLIANKEFLLNRGDYTLNG